MPALPPPSATAGTTVDGSTRGWWVADATVTVRGSARRQVAPTSVVVHGQLVTAGDDRQASFEELVADQQRVTDALGDAAVTFTRVTSHEDRGDRGAGTRHAAALELEVADVEEVGAAIGGLVDLGVEVLRTEWRIADDAPAHGEVRRAAVEDAVARARDYAAALGMALGPLVSVTDGASGGDPRPMAMAARAEGRGGAEALLAPQPVTVAAGAEVRFTLVADSS